ncbi:zinc finger BED domain-containing protein RICESLEEPER 2-like isoform X2 [Rosa rugosa]|nr:zinc finger BED domain-containing protein RICESLEEPER 2-like isoform X2 [Rosa rugosa]XP_061995800.1 zinc finger BED domain-containing protein RICESLEEPER 2-like isoform X2 [Rosa rugosa]XP_061995801.1 zinc finger BED domain-containing protein RICESLEEPER 2-like isoform X2 [Rosa rugosa]
MMEGNSNTVTPTPTSIEAASSIGTSVPSFPASEISPTAVAAIVSVPPGPVAIVSGQPTDSTAGTDAPGLESTSKRKNKSVAWEHFTKMKNPNGTPMAKPRAKCNYCPQTHACHSKSNGTSSMKTHMLYQCKKCLLYIPAKKQRCLTFDSIENGGNVVVVQYDPDRSRLLLAKMIIRDELPFSHVEGEGFKEFMRVTVPKIHLPSRRTIARDIWDLYQNEKTALKNMS